MCAGYPTYYLIDLIPISKQKEFKEKYGFYTEDCELPMDKDYKVIYEGYKNEKFYEIEETIKNNI